MARREGINHEDTKNHEDRFFVEPRAFVNT
jgi:hypothetical protein